MHEVSNERTLAHWQALQRLPDAAQNELTNRFVHEQPMLVSVTMPLMGGVETGPDGQQRVRELEDPKLDAFLRVASVGAVMSEVLCRETGRPLRQLEEAEVLAITEDCGERLKQLEASPEGKSPAEQNYFITCAQRHLLVGATLALAGESRKARPDLPRTLWSLRIFAEGLHRACGAEPATTPRGWDAERVRFALSVQGDPLRGEALAAADALREELAPMILAELESWAADPQAALEEDGSFGTHGMYLLAKWRAEEAWPVFRKLFSLPSQVNYALLGDLITEHGSILLAMVGGGRCEELRAMVEDESLCRFCRGACLDALTCLVAWGERTREEHVAYLRELLTGRLPAGAQNKPVFGAVVSVACDLEAEELRPAVERAFARGWVDKSVVDLDYYNDCLSDAVADSWPSFCNRHRVITDIAAVTKWLDQRPDGEPREEFDNDPDLFPELAAPGPLIAPPKVGRNEPCPCGSGKKFKKCCGK